MTPRAEITSTTHSSSLSSSVQCPPDFVAVILAASSGARLFPLTTTSDVNDGGGGGASVPSFDDDDGSDHPPPEPNQKTVGGSNDEEDVGGGGGGGVGGGLPKHLLPVGGTPVLTRLLRTVHRCGRFRYCVVAVAHGDRSTPRDLRRLYRCIDEEGGATKAAAAADVVRLVSDDGCFVVTVATLPPDCAGSADALRHLISVEVDDDDDPSSPSSSAAAAAPPPARRFVIPRGSGVVVMPGDLVLEGGGLLGLLADAHRGSGPGSGGGEGFGSALGGGRGAGHRRGHRAVASSCTVLLSDVGEEDEAGIPLKESAKHKKGGLARDEEDMEYIGLSSVSRRTAAELRRVVLKRSKIDVEEDAEMAGDTPKLSFPKSRLVGGGGGGGRNDGGTVCVRTDLSDLHVYALSPWVLRLIQSRTKLTSLQGEVLPLLITRQFKGVRAAFGGGGDVVGRNRGESFSLRQGGSSSMQIQGGGQDQTTPREEVPNDVLTSLWEDAAKPWPWSTTRLGDVEGGLDGGNSDDVTSRVVDPPAYETRSSSSSSSSGGGVAGGGVLGGQRKASPPPEMPFVVTCTVLPRGSRLAVRACTVPSYLYACREMVAHSIRFPPPEELLVVARDASFGGFTPPSGVGGAAGRGGGASVLSSALASSFDGLEGRILHKFNSVVLPDCDVGDKVTIKSSTVGRRCTLGNRCRLNNVVLMDGAVIGENCVLQNSVIGPGATVGENCSLNDVQVGPGADVASGTKLKGESVTKDMVMLDAPSGGTGFS